MSRLLSKRSSPSSERGVSCSIENPARATVLLPIVPMPVQQGQIWVEVKLCGVEASEDNA